MNYNFSCELYSVEYCPKNVTLEVKTKSNSWRWRNDRCSVLFNSGQEISLKDAKNCECFEYKTGIRNGIKAVYSGFENSNIVVKTVVSIDSAYNELYFELDVEGDTLGEVAKVFWPAAFDFTAEEGKGYSVYPQMQGVLLPAKWPGTTLNYNDGKIYERDAYMPFYGQVENDAGYITIIDSPYDANFYVDHTPSLSTYIRPAFRASLGRMAYKRVAICFFYDECDYNTFCKKYRFYLKERGRFVTLAEKAARNPAVEKLYGTPIIHTGIAVHIHEKSNYYHKDEPEKNDYYTSFKTRENELRALKNKGVEKAYLHLDGWGNHGYDNLHPDVFPPHGKSGGTEGMKSLSDTCNELGYVFGIHDQYRDYYHDAESFDFNNAIMNIDGTNPYCSIWYGGPHSYLCQQLSPDYVRRNYQNFKNLGIHIGGSYLDVYAVVELDECFNPDHPMTRKQSAEKRNECFEILNANGIISSSEEVTDFALTSIALCHHAPFATRSLSKGEAIGISVPLFTLVYHECIVVPWFGLNSLGGWGIADKDWGFLYALLCGGTIYYDTNTSSENIELGKTALNLHKKLIHSELVKHEFLDSSYRRQRSTFNDGTVVEVDFDNQSYSIK